MTWWVRRFDLGGRVPVPLPKDRPVQAIDVRDAASFALAAAQDGRSGIFNVTSAPFSMAQLVDSIRLATANDATPVWIEEPKFIASGVTPWTELPLWLPGPGPFQHFFDVSIAKGAAAGLRTRPLHETIANILDWDRRRRTASLTCGLSPEHEAALLAGVN